VAALRRKGCCHGNPPIESLFHTLQVELVHQQRRATPDDAQRDRFATL